MIFHYLYTAQQPKSYGNLHVYGIITQYIESFKKKDCLKSKKTIYLIMM